MAQHQATQDEDDWAPTPPQERRRARLIDGEIVEYKDLKPGDIFQSLSVDDRPIHPHDQRFPPPTDDETFAACTAPPVRGHTEDPHVGWMVEVVCGTREQLVRRYGN